MDRYKTIDGWFREMEARFYRHQVRRVENGSRFVEIGSWKGRSSYCMADAIRRSKKRIEFWCVDTWQGSNEHKQMNEVAEDTLYEDFLAAVRPVRHYLHPLRRTSLEAASQFADQSLDFVFIDAAHDFDSVMADIAAWRPKVKPEGVLAGHDYRMYWTGVIQAVEAAFGTSASVFGPCWYFSEKSRNGAPLSLRAWTNRLHWRFRRLANPQTFVPQSSPHGGTAPTAKTAA